MILFFYQKCINYCITDQFEIRHTTCYFGRTVEIWEDPALLLDRPSQITKATNQIYSLPIQVYLIHSEAFDIPNNRYVRLI